MHNEYWKTSLIKCAIKRTQHNGQKKKNSRIELNYLNTES